MRATPAAVLLALFVPTSCRTDAPVAPPPPAADEYSDSPFMTGPTPAEDEAEDFVFVFLKAGPAEASLSPEELQAASAGHRENIERLEDRGLLLLAGPFGEPRVDPSYRGIFVFDLASVDEARKWTETDPAVVAGALELEAHPWRTYSPMREIPELNDRARTEAGGFVGRAYVLGTASEAEDAHEILAPLAAEKRVLFSGWFGGELDGTLLFVLDFESLDEAREALAFAQSSSTLNVQWTLHPWYASAGLIGLPDADS